MSRKGNCKKLIKKRKMKGETRASDLQGKKKRWEMSLSFGVIKAIGEKGEKKNPFLRCGGKKTNAYGSVLWGGGEKNAALTESLSQQHRKRKDMQVTSRAGGWKSRGQHETQTFISKRKKMRIRVKKGAKTSILPSMGHGKGEGVRSCSKKKEEGRKCKTIYRNSIQDKGVRRKTKTPVPSLPRQTDIARKDRRAAGGKGSERKKREPSLTWGGPKRYNVPLKREKKGSLVIPKAG